MVLVAVREKNALDLLQVVLKVGYVGHNEVYAEHIVAGEAEAAVYHYNIIAVLEGGDVLAYLAKTAQGYYAKLFQFCFCH